MGLKSHTLIVDTSGFLGKLPLWEYGEKLVTVDEVFNEIKNQNLQDYVAAFPIAVDFQQPRPGSLKFMNDFSKKTGDYHSLSLTDLKILALTYELEVAAKGSAEHLRTEPAKRTTNTQESIPVAQIQYEDKSNKRAHTQSILESLPELEAEEDDADNSIEQSSADSNQDGDDAGDEWSVIKRKKVKGPAVPAYNDTASIKSTTSSKISASDVLRWEMQPGFYMPPDLEDEDDTNTSAATWTPVQNSEGCLSGPAILQPLEDHLTCYSYISGYQPHWAHELLIIELLEQLFSLKKTSSNRLSKENGNSSIPEQLEPDNLSFLRYVLEQGVGYWEQRQQSRVSLEQYPCVHRWYSHITSFPTDTQNSTAAATHEGTKILQAVDMVLEESITVEEEVEDEEKGCWVTPGNIEKLKDDCANTNFIYEDQELDEEQALVACMTADFSMQNVLRHVGLSVVGVNGRVIKNTRCYVLRCYTCYTITPDMAKLFCTKCGNKTLKRVSMTINEDGTQQIWISKRPLSTRGLKFNLPKPRGGHHAIMPLLTADQRFPHQWAKRSKGVNPLNADYIAGPSPFASRDLSSRAAVYGLQHGQDRGVKGQLRHAKIWKPKKKRSVKK